MPELPRNGNEERRRHSHRVRTRQATVGRNPGSPAGPPRSPNTGLTLAPRGRDVNPGFRGEAGGNWSGAPPDCFSTFPGNIGAHTRV